MTTHISPTEAINAPLTDWIQDIESFDTLEIHPCVVTDRDSNGTEYVERCEPAAAQFWTVYGHYRTGCVNAFEDFLTEAEAIDFRDRLIAAYPHLAEQNGIEGNL